MTVIAEISVQNILLGKGQKKHGFTVRKES